MYEGLKIDDALVTGVLEFANKVFGYSAQSVDELADLLLPEDVLKLKKLAVLYESQMLAARDGQAYLASCVLGAAMIESFLLLLCLLSPTSVQSTNAYRKRAGKRFNENEYEGIVTNMGLEELIEISSELEWIPADLIDNEWKQVLPEAYKEVVAKLRPNTSKAKREQAAASLVATPAYSLMLLLNIIRNHVVHPSRWIRERQKLENEEAFSQWAQVAIVAASHISQCLFYQFQLAVKPHMQRKLSERIQLLSGTAPEEQLS